jgi:CheY-like chemotaxis protein
MMLCDWKMPQMSGLEVLKRVRSRAPDLPFLMITGLADPGSLVEAKSHGVSGYIKKPFSLDQLRKKLALIQRILAHRTQAA